ncbi:uncharacterized protein LOC106178987 [Lingula anatina]|uniref:Uncharacterized protein LOC106178987 n=1 Tax=Lingula anatina TaxID=7574 RepID=A0A1S3K626_LINAN|nr:uncharacterized protein LOC106178987 [Lingula anatina]XP_013417884.1 uncharacterized protein LOC106178987 [Lingula anatina]XP_013417885.1 uncharacterized protein LOC106178987 [Lingula anatina]|eukprot:XP_013417883.1 uncharacterized protein LOC106178987 [Lingula anatina]
MSAKRCHSPSTTRTLRSLGHYENLLAAMHECKNTTVAFTSWINSKLFLSDDVWKTSLQLLQKNIPHLRLNIEWQDGKRYFKYMDDPYVDMEIVDVTSDDDWKMVHEDMMRVQFLKENAPLWRVKILRMLRPSDISHNSDYRSYALNGYPSFVVFGIHHVILDGTSYILMLKKLLQYLNAVSKDDPIEKDEVVTFHRNMEALLPQDQMVFKWTDYYKVLKERIHSLFPYHSPCMKRFPPPPNSGEEYTKTVALEFTISETERLIAKCKEHQTTVHGALVAAASIALVNAINAGATPRPADVPTSHAVNMRRFMPPEFQNAFGLFFGLTNITVSVPAVATYQSFWELAKSSKHALHANLNNGNVIQGCKIRGHLLPDDNSVKGLLASDQCKYDMGTSNIGDCDKHCPPGEADDNVHATRIVTSAAMQNLSKLFYHYLHKFRGRFCYNLDYGTNWVCEVNAIKQAEMTVELMKMAAGEEKY